MEKSSQFFTMIKHQKKDSFYFLSVILIDSVYRKDKIYCPQVFLEEYKYVVIEKKIA